MDKVTHFLLQHAPRGLLRVPDQKVGIPVTPRHPGIVLQLWEENCLLCVDLWTWTSASAPPQQCLVLQGNYAHCPLVQLPEECRLTLNEQVCSGERLTNREKGKQPTRTILGIKYRTNRGANKLDKRLIILQIQTVTRTTISLLIPVVECWKEPVVLLWAILGER